MTFPDFSILESQLGIKFNNQDLLKQAFTHRSYLNENPGWHLEHNERLEFLGDAVIEIIVTEYLYHQFPRTPEGQLTNFRAALVNSYNLSETAANLGFNDFILLSRGETKELGRSRQYILANVFEAFIGAFYLDRGYDAVKTFLEKTLLSQIKDVISSGKYKDAKSLFQEKAQEKLGITPSYQVMEECGPDHDKIFTVGLFLKNKLIAKGQGPSKQLAEVEAAQAALEEEGWKKY